MIDFKMGRAMRRRSALLAVRGRALRPFAITRAPRPVTLSPLRRATPTAAVLECPAREQDGRHRPGEDAEVRAERPVTHILGVELHARCEVRAVAA